MKKIFTFVILIAATLISACTSVSTPPEPKVESTLLRSSKGPLVQQRTDLIEATATVKKINYQSREVVLLSHNGTETKIIVSDEIKRLNEIKVGDQVKAKYYESLAFEVRPVTEKERSNPATFDIVAGKTDLDLPPGVEVASVLNTIVTIVAIDQENATVTVLTPNKSKQVLNVNIPENLTRVKVGDTVLISYAEAVALSINPLVK